MKPGPTAKRTAEATRKRLLNEVAERRNPRTKATVDQLLERYLDQFDGAPNTLTLYRGYVRNHISPFLGHLKVGQVDDDILDSFYAELRRCSIDHPLVATNRRARSFYQRGGWKLAGKARTATIGGSDLEEVRWRQ